MSVFPLSMLSVLIVIIALSAVGFYKFTYFISVGYGLSIAGAGLSIACLYSGMMTFPTFMLCFLLIIYGLRLAGFLLYREYKAKDYQNIFKRSNDVNVKISSKIGLWLSVSLLYLLQVSPVLYRAYNGGDYNAFVIIGIIVILAGIFIEAMADFEKYRAKQKDPHHFVSGGLYHFCKCPNYFGELLVWTGVIISGIGGVSGIGQWIVCLLGYLAIAYIMLTSTKRLEASHLKRYGDDPQYQEYAEHTPILIPFVPIYHFKDIRWIV